MFQHRLVVRFTQLSSGLPRHIYPSEHQPICIPSSPLANPRGYEIALYSTHRNGGVSLRTNYALHARHKRTLMPRTEGGPDILHMAWSTIDQHCLLIDDAGDSFSLKPPAREASPTVSPPYQAETRVNALVALGSDGLLGHCACSIGILWCCIDYRPPLSLSLARSTRSLNNV
ncbi:unnamed protein product [Acanthosepion pharaonis]|uniref:Uncharacterized protein n=1 Tax=Acanthosepion pharaonis TaxID=158019 RepID=A0A812D386_ACAPH|nr:unnamed protein product [Sepia pharaonis]